METQQFTPLHYSELKRFWAQYGWTAPDIDLLPKRGYVAMKEGKILAAAFVYMSCSGMAMMDWVIGDKDAVALDRGMAVIEVVKECQKYATEHKKSVLYTITGNTHLQDVYRIVGFKNMESNVTSMAMSLDGANLDFLGE